MKRICFTILSVFILSFCYSQEKEMERLIKDFQSDDWPVVLNAKEELENMEGLSIPFLMGMIKENKSQKLLNTGDLIYPGAEKFFGHGQIIDYDIDQLDIRAGWLLEDITFQNFGFSGIHIEQSALDGFIKSRFPQYYEKNNEKLVKLTEAEKRNIIKKLSIAEAEKWWNEKEANWSRYQSLLSSLQSRDERRQVKGLFYIRNGKSICSGLTRESYNENIRPLIVELSKSGIKRVSEQAKLILVDTEFEWLFIKTSY